MEGLIFALVVMALGVLFNNKKPGGSADSADRPSGSAGPNQPAPRRSAKGNFKRAEDYAREIYGEFQSQMNPGEQPEVVREAAEKAQKAVEKPQVAQSRKKESTQPSPGRLSAHQKQGTEQAGKKDVKEELFPLTHTDAQKGIILAEIFMPPKSKR